MAAGRVHTRSSPDAVDWRRREVTVGGERFRYRALVATIPLPELLKRMTELPPEIETQAARLRCTTLRYLNIGARGQPPADWHWIYVPEQRYPFYRVNVFSTAMPSMAPPGCASICVEMADRGPITDAAVRDTAAALVAAGAIGDANDVVFAEPKQIEYAYVVFDQHYYEATRVIFAFLEKNGIYPRGRYGAWTYNAMEDCVLAGREVAALIDRRRRGRGVNEPGAAPHLSIVIPVYNEEGILRGSVLELEEKLRRFGWSYELLLCENGSRDRTVEIGKELRGRAPAGPDAVGGRAELRPGDEAGDPRGARAVRDLRRDRSARHRVLRARDGAARAQRHRPGGRVEGDGRVERSAAAVPARRDPRLQRHAARGLPLPGTDTHGLKAFRREALLDTARRCMLDRDVFASEFVIRAHREGKKVVEIPFAVREKRPPSIRLIARVPHVVKSVAKLAVSVRRTGDR